MSKETFETAELRKLVAEAELAQAETRKLELEVEELERRNIETITSPSYAGVYTFYSRVDGESVRNAMRDLGSMSRRSPGKPFKVIFNSPGGSVIDGLALFDFLRELSDNGHKIETVALGMAASMGGILLQAGDHRVIGKNAYVLIHEISSVNFGKFSEMEDELKFLQRLQDRLVGILSERATMTKQQIRLKWKKTDWWLDAAEVLKYQFADEVR